MSVRCQQQSALSHMARGRMMAAVVATFVAGSLASLLQGCTATGKEGTAAQCGNGDNTSSLIYSLENRLKSELDEDITGVFNLRDVLQTLTEKQLNELHVLANSGSNNNAGAFLAGALKATMPTLVERSLTSVDVARKALSFLLSLRQKFTISTMISILAGCVSAVWKVSPVFASITTLVVVLFYAVGIMGAWWVLQKIHRSKSRKVVPAHLAPPKEAPVPSPLKGMPELPDLDVNGLIEIATKEHQRGSTAFTDKTESARYTSAKDAWLKALRILKQVEQHPEYSKEDERSANVVEMRCKLHTNLAQCYLKTGGYSEAAVHAEIALRLEPKDQKLVLKALYRKARALIEPHSTFKDDRLFRLRPVYDRESISNAEAALEEGRRLDPTNSDIRQLSSDLERAKNKIESRNKAAQNNNRFCNVM